MKKTLLDYACRYIERFGCCIPVGTWCSTDNSGKTVDYWKVPVLKKWTENPLRTTQQAAVLWHRFADYGHVPGIGLPTGQMTGFIVIDFDHDHGGGGVDGYENYLSWSAQTGIELPDTWVALTPSGGQHWYYRCDIAMRCFSNQVEGIDLRADGGYIVVPPSPHKSGGWYQWEASSPENAAEADEAVFAFLDHFRPSKSEYRPTTRRGEGGERKMALPPEIPEGGRTAALISLIGTLNRLGVSDEAIILAVRTENRLKCEPPLTEQELQQTIFPAIFRWEKGIPADNWKDKDTWRNEKKMKVQTFTPGTIPAKAFRPGNRSE